MDSFWPALALLGVSVAGVLGVYGAAALVRGGGPLEREPYMGGGAVTEHAVSRFHVRWYAVTLLFLAFDMEMVFMYPWVLVVAEKGVHVVVEMFAFLAVLLAAVVYAWREGAFRWS
ncbi:NADH-quinone oxidoreductase subunit A [Streptomonospora wellingtoniae]|uniref:NADH-quinone oxidoreductase subunit n=1 Tax=Streptomonospora wellingtoniae TaxID=3075544 RepID=A0ABU2KWM1_9ACTN|nr:NADH-quinone oxidoreductase subunit A [Streptomonospora sp. DSM 45055]MDT0303695.1 NADH-quinone oxidoreductase subunit A [Streptomonospora sp. DSM 45055]